MIPEWSSDFGIFLGFSFEALKDWMDLFRIKGFGLIKGFLHCCLTWLVGWLYFLDYWIAVGKIGIARWMGMDGMAWTGRKLFLSEGRQTAGQGLGQGQIIHSRFQFKAAHLTFGRPF